jgi:hypothetical protein
LVADQLRLLLPPVPIEVGLALTDTTGGFVALPVEAVTLVLALPVPPALVQARV